MGHPARVDDAVQNCSLDAIVARSEAAAIVREVRKDIEKQFVSPYTNNLYTIFLTCYMLLRVKPLPSESLCMLPYSPTCREVEAKMGNQRV